MTFQQRVGDKKRARRHLGKCSKQRHPVIGLAPENHATHKEADRRRDDRKYQRECGVGADRQANLAQCPYSSSGGLHESTYRTSAWRLELRKVWRKEDDKDRQRQNDQRYPYTSRNDEPATMQLRFDFVVPFMT